MEALSSVVIVGLIVIGVVDALKDVFNNPAHKRIKGFVTVLVAALVGAAWAVVDGHLGFVPDLTLAQGISAGLVGAGAVGLKKK